MLLKLCPWHFLRVKYSPAGGGNASIQEMRPPLNLLCLLIHPSTLAGVSFDPKLNHAENIPAAIYKIGSTTSDASPLEEKEKRKKKKKDLQHLQTAPLNNF